MRDMNDGSTDQPDFGLPPVTALNRFSGLSAGELPVVVDEPRRAAERWAVPVGRYRLLVEPAIECELSEWVTIWPVPNTPRWISGVINLRGTLVPVFDLRPLFPAHVDWPPRNRKLLFVVGSGDNAGAIVTDGLPYRQRLDDAPADPVPDELPGAIAAWVSAAYGQGDVCWLDCDLPGLLQELGTRTDNNIAGADRHETPT
jgi:twitching motility protein PilI